LFNTFAHRYRRSAPWKLGEDAGMARIIAIGGGGFPSGTSPGLDDFLVSQLDGTARRIGYVGTASDDDPTRLRFFHALIAPRVAHASIFPGEPGGDAARRWLARHDMIYVGGGDTARMLARWRKLGFDVALAEAHRNGTVLAGVSAGAVCWFEHALVRGESGAMEPINGLGLLKGSMCAHFNLDSDRRPAFLQGIGSGLLPSGLGIDDGVAVVFRDGVPPAAWSAEPGCWAYGVSIDSEGSVSSVALPAFV
jgi:peptidase E